LAPDIPHNPAALNAAPRHPRVRSFIAQQLLSGVSSFAEFEQRVEALPTPDERGAMFDVFAECWLATQRIPQARNVWPGNTAPLALLQKLRLPLKDMGVDGVFETAVDEPTCYQVKFRTGRPSLTWTELATFFGLSDVACGRLVFTNCDEIAEVAKGRPGVVIVRGIDLDRLTSDDFRVMEDWLSGAAIRRKPKTPRPHQAAAISDIVGALGRNPRATALMACGTGKTLVALWVAERLGVRTVLVLLPSLALVRQTLHEWLRETNWPEIEYCCVCSDPTVQPEEDSLVVRQTDLDFRVTTESTSVRRFLERTTPAVRIVFSTYQSSAVVAEGVKGLAPFDLGIFDEAHKTAGREGARFALALKDEQLPITRRLFLTATPRHYDLTHRNRTGDAEVVFSMDNPAVYGPVAHRLPFSKAASPSLKIITDYKVVISIVTSEMVTDELLRRGVVLVKGEEIKARQVANQLALQSAIEKQGVRKVFTFHSKVDSAKSFVSSGPEGIATHLPNFLCAHINGEMSTAYRERLMREFERVPQAIMSNARCLTEGVDVPAVDMVAFLSPRRSLVDIVQATGRAMRRVEGKEFGYVLVPLYVEERRGETIEEAVERSDFDEVWNVLNRLQEHDDLLAQIIAEMRTQRGKTGGFDDSRFRERVQILGPSISLEALRSSITAACLDAIGDLWFERYGQLVAYKEKHGNCDVPSRMKPLGTWVVNQRVLMKDGLLDEAKVELLNRIAFNWDPKASVWRTHYLALIAFRDRVGHCRVPENWPENKKLAKWVKTQRVRRQRGKLSAERIMMLERVGFEWEVLSMSWHDRLEELRQYKLQRGHTRVPARWPENQPLASWVTEQRYRYRRNKLTSEQINVLNESGFEWEVQQTREAAWEQMFQRLVAFHDQHGHFRLTENTPENKSLAEWMQRQRNRMRAGRLPDEYEQRLSAIGFPWKPLTGPDADWEPRYQQLKQHRAATGGFHFNWNASGERSLARWAKSQRKAFGLGALTPERVALLNAIGFNWENRSQKTGTSKATSSSAVQAENELPWEVMCARLENYFKLHGNSNVPADWSSDTALAGWVVRQRVSKAKENLTPEQIRRLEVVGFAWTAHQSEWDAMFAELSALLKAQSRPGGAARLPSAELKRWMLTQRQFKKQGRLSKERWQRLDSIDFDWDPFASQWERMFVELRDYHAQRQHCRVPLTWSENPRLGHWVGVQRQQKKRGRLAGDRVAKLDSLGFDWSLVGKGGGRANQHVQSRSEAWGLMLSELQQFHAEHGHARVPQGYSGNRKLAYWVTTQRRSYRKGKLSEQQIAQLDALSFQWSATGKRTLEETGRESGSSSKRIPTWDEMFAAFKEYRDQHGSLNVLKRSTESRSLAHWIVAQRMARNRGRLAPDRERQLTDLGFDWNPVGNRWDEMFAALAEFKKEHGHTNVPQRSRRYPGLATWVKNQRLAQKMKRPVMIERRRRLDELGFHWIEDMPTWEDMFARLTDFKKAHGHCRVPQNWREDRRLGKWVNTQRTHFKRGNVKPHRQRLLDELGFVWNAAPKSNEHHYP
jgi:superfamily II DNA or RNA helicase